MIICPDCSFQIGTHRRCPNCQWEVGDRLGIDEYLSTTDRTTPGFSGYLDNYALIAQDDLQQTMQPHARLDAEADRVASYIGDILGSDVCEIGVGQGYLFRRLLSSSARALTGIDIAAEYLAQFQPDAGSRLVIANAENVPFDDEFDLIVATDILEHVLNPGDFLLSARRALRPNGRLFVRVPHKENLIQYARIAGCPYAFVHLRSFDRRGLARELRSAGFRPETVWYDGYTLDRARSLLRRLQGTHFSPWDPSYWAESWKRRDESEPVESAPRAVQESSATRTLRHRARNALIRIGESNTLLSRMLMQPVTVSILARKVG